MTILYSNALGSFVFEDGKLKDSRLAKSPLDYSLELEKGVFTSEEKELIKKYGKVDFLGFKEEKNTNVNVVSDITKLTKISQTLVEKGFLKQLREVTIAIARKKIKHSMKRETFIIQTINNILELDKVTNVLVKRLREWYSYYFPELSEGIQSHDKFTELLQQKDRSALMKERKISETMGGEARKEDLDEMKRLAKRVEELYKLRKEHEIYLEKIMKEECPNITAIAGSLIAAKLLAIAGSLQKLANFPASTVQLLGAEKALFRHLRSGSRVPKHGVIVEHQLIVKASKNNKGKAARILADKLSIAAKVDYFKGEFVGEKLKKQVEDKIGKLK